MDSSILVSSMYIQPNTLLQLSRREETIETTFEGFKDEQ